MEGAEGAVDGHFLLGEQGQLGKVASPFGFANLRAHLPLASDHGALLNLLDGAEDFVDFRGLGFSKECFREEGALRGVFDGFHGVCGSARGEGLQGAVSAEVLKPCGLLGDGGGGGAARGFKLGIGDGEGAKQNSLHFRECGGAGFDAVATFESGLTQFLAQDGRVDAELLGGVGGELVAGELLGDAADVGQEEVHGLDLLLGAGTGEELAGALDEVVGLAAGAFDGLHVGLKAAFANEAVRIEAVVECDDLDGEALFREQGDGLFRGVGTGGIGIEVDDDVGGVALENVDLLLGEGGSAGGDDVMDAAQVDGDAVHLAFNEKGVSGLTDGGFGLVEIEEDLAFGVERGLWRVDVFGAGLVAGFERAGGEGDDASAFVGDGEHDALAESVVERALGPVLVLL